VIAPSAEYGESRSYVPKDACSSIVGRPDGERGLGYWG
jgi:hypothetical protein